ncbi:MAG: hypothetical protein H7Y31_09070 [Chitinophagaceae bacterium]|nr:hypothetical protein [Chitinophagaceae bacterium]
MTHKTILVISDPGNMNDNLYKWVSNANGFDLEFASTDEEAIELCAQRLYDMVLMDGTDFTINRKKLLSVVPILNSEAVLLAYQGEEIDTLDEKVKIAFDIKKMKRLQQLLILDSTGSDGVNGFVPFSLN